MAIIGFQSIMFQTFGTYYRTAVADLRYQGIEVLMWRVLVKLFSPLVKLDLQILFDLDLTQAFQVKKAKLECTIEQASEADIDAILDMQMQRFAPDEVAQLGDGAELQYAQLLRLRATAHETYQKAMYAGEQCYVARVDGSIAHSNWLRVYGCAPLDTCALDLKPGEIYTTDGFTREVFRGQRLHEAVATHMLQVAKQLGYQRAYTITDLTKAGSRRGVNRIGWARRGSILYVSPRGLKRTWLVRLGGDLTPLFDHVRAGMTVER